VVVPVFDPVAIKRPPTCTLILCKGSSHTWKENELIDFVLLPRTLM